MSRPKYKKKRRAPVVEVLEPRVLFSADSLSAIGAALLPDHNDANPLLNPLSANFGLNNAPSDSTDNGLDSDTLLIDNSDVTADVELVFVDERVPEIQSVVHDITTNKGDHVVVVVLSNTESGINVISETLTQFESVQAVHIVSHSFGDGVRLGSDILNSNSVEEHENTIAGWANALTVNADLLLYGCELASTDKGLALMSELSLLTTADVAASANHTGHDSNGGDWFLEISTGVIETANLVSDALQSQWNHILATWDSSTNTITIDHDSDQFTPGVARYASLEALYLDSVASGSEISLREAVVAANTGGQAATIVLTGSDYYLTSNVVQEADDDDSAQSGDLDIKGDINIIGAGKGQTTIHAQAAQGVNEFRILDYHSGVSQLTGVTITGGVVDGNGGGIRADGALVYLTDVELRGNETLGAGIGGGISFTAIYAEVTDVLITENKSATDGGGAAITNATVKFTNTIVSLNNATNAAGVLAGDKSDVNMYGATIEENTASESGGGIGAMGGNVQLLDNSVVQNNTATVSGGGIFVTTIGEQDSSPAQAGNAFIRNSEINNNEALTGFGGGITAQGHTSQTNDITYSSVTLERSTLFGNESVTKSGGAVNAYLAKLIVEDSIFDSNKAKLYGGALHGTYEEIWINDSTFTSNTATRGGGLNLTAADTANINYSTFFNNNATGNGGALHIVDGLIGIRNSTIAGNTADNLFAAISTNGSSGTVNLSNSIVANNISSNNGGMPTANVQQLDIGVTSSDQGFNLVTTEAATETNFEYHITDIIEQNLPDSYVINSGLADALDTESITNSHSRHLSLKAGSDAIDSGRRTDAIEYDAYGILSNEFVDIGATEYIAETPANKIFFSSDLANTNSVYRMNEDGTGLQKIIEFEEFFLSDPSILDVAYDPKTQQLFLIRKFVSEYDVLIASADGEYDESHRLETGGVSISALTQPGDSYATLALAIEQTPEGTDNILYLAQQQFLTGVAPETFQILSVPITTDWDYTNNNPAIWTPILYGDITDVRVDITMPSSTYEVGQIAALDVVRSSSGDLYISWADSDTNNTGTNNPHFVIAENGVANRAYELLTLTGDSLPNDYARDISYNPTTNQLSLLTLFASYQVDLIPLDSLWYLSVPGSGSNTFNSLDQDISTDTLYATQAIDGIGVQTATGPVNWYPVDGTPEALTIAPLTPVNTPPRTPLPPEVAVAPTFSIDVDELGTAPIDNTVLFAVDDGANGETPPIEIIYIVRGQPENGTLNFDGTAIWNNATFSQEDVNQGRLTYTHTDSNTARDPILFDIWDSVEHAPTISRTLEVNIADVPDVAVLRPNLTIAENTISGSHVFGYVQIADIAFNSGHTIQILDELGNPHPDITVDGNKIIANKTFDFELLDPLDPTFNFYIQVENTAGALSAIVEQTVTVANVNEAPTISGESAFSIDENTYGVLQGVGFTYNNSSIEIVDVDSTNLRYTIIQDDVAGVDTHFYYDTNDGLIKLRTDSEINFEALGATDNSINLILRVSDQEGVPLLAQHNLTVTVNDVLEDPTITGQSYVEVDENLTGSIDGIVNRPGSTSTPMTGVTVTDEKYDLDPIDPSNAYTLSVHENANPQAPVSSRFSINSAGQLYVIKTDGLDFETDGPTHPLYVRVTDNEGLTDTHQITVGLRDVYEAPYIQGALNFSINENADGLVLNTGGTAAMDPLFVYNPESATLAYSLYEIDDTDPANEIATLSTRFTFDSMTGLVSLQTGQEINYELERDPIKLRLIVADNVTDVQHNFSIHVNDQAEAPEINGIGAVQVAENFSGITDGVLRDTVTNSPMTGLVITDEQFDPNNPLVNPYSVIVKEIDGINEFVSTRFAIDDNGQLFVSQPGGLNFETDQHNYMLRIEVTDAEDLVATRDITVTLNPVNESPDISGNNTGYIDENTDGILKDVTGLNPMTAVSIADPELDDTLQPETLTHNIYEIGSSTTPASERFWMGDDGLIRLRAGHEIDFEAENGPIELRIESTDTAGNTDTHTFFVNVNDLTEAPEISGIGAVQVDENVSGLTDGVLRDTLNNNPMPGLVITDEQYDPSDPTLNKPVVSVKEVDTTSFVETLSTRFAIDDNGQLYVSQPGGLDFETDPHSYHLHIEVKDAEGEISSHDITVTLNPINEAPTIVGSKNFAITENYHGVLQNALLNTDMESLIVNNPEDETLNYEVFEIDYSDPLNHVATLSSRFTFDNTTGQISLAQDSEINFEEESGPLALELRVTDSANNVATHEFDVRIDNQPEAPIIGDSIALAQVSENATGVVDGVLRDTTNNTPMAGLIVTDEQFDPNFPDTNPYKVIVKEVDTTTSVETLSTRFAMDQNGQLYVSQPGGLDFETDPQSYLLRVEVTDVENLVTTRDITVMLNPVNEAPSITGPNSASVSENVTGPIDGVLIDTDTDPNSPMIGFQVSDEEHTYDSAANPLNFTLTENGVQSNRFGIDASGVVYVNQNDGLNYEQVESPITLTVTVIDSGGLTDSSNIEISVTNVNELHTVDGPTNLEIVENSVGILIDTDTDETMAPIAGYDPDGNTLTYELVDTGPLSSLFSLTADNRLQTNEPLNYESVIEQNPNGVIDLQVAVTDNEPGGETQTHNVVVTVVDSNDAPAHGDALSNLVATETEPFSFTVPSNTFTDEDGEIPTAYVTQANGDPLPAWINVERNAENNLVLSGTPGDADSGITLDLIAWAEDTSNAASPAMPFQLTVGSQNQAPSDIALNTVSGQKAIPELEEGFEIGTFTTVDNDASDNDHVYSIIGELNQSRFEITEEGVLKLRDGMELDYETEQVISIDIQTDDQAGGQYIKTFEFSVLDVNEAPTVELPTAANVNENESDVVVATINLSDAETATADLNVTLTNADGSETTEFALNENNEILLTAPIDHEQVREVELELNVSDGENIQSYPITIEVLNVNEAPSLVVLTESATQTPTIKPDAPFSLSSIIISDPDVGDEPVLTIREQGSDSLPEWLQFDAEQNTLEIVGTPDSSASEILIDFIVNDGKGGAAVETVTFSIPPQLAAAEPEPEPEPELEVVPIAETQPVIETVVQTEPDPVVQEAEPEQTETADLATDNEIDTSLSASEIDLASLIKPLEKIALVDLSNNGNTIDVIQRDINLLQLDTSDFSNEWNDLETAFSQPSDIEFEDLASEFDRQREEMVEQIANTQTLIGSSFTISSGLSVGYILWLIRGGTLMGSVLSSLPAWRLVDPLPILGSLGDDFGEDEESLETMVQNEDPENPEGAEQTAA